MSMVYQNTKLPSPPTAYAVIPALRYLADARKKHRVALVLLLLLFRIIGSQQNRLRAGIADKERISQAYANHLRSHARDMQSLAAELSAAEISTK
jgi:hypothetical protein